MAIAAASTAARSIFRSSSIRNATSRLASQAKSARSPFGLPSRTPLAHRIFRSPAEMSACLESMQPYHTATASALMTSMLTASRFGYSWLSEGGVNLLLSFFTYLAMMMCDELWKARKYLNHNLLSNNQTWEVKKFDWLQKGQYIVSMPRTLIDFSLQLAMMIYDRYHPSKAQARLW